MKKLHILSLAPFLLGSLFQTREEVSQFHLRSDWDSIVPPGNISRSFCFFFASQDLAQKHLVGASQNLDLTPASCRPIDQFLSLGETLSQSIGEWKDHSLIEKEGVPR